MSSRSNCIILTIFYIIYTIFYGSGLKLQSFFILDWNIFIKVSMLIFPIYLLLLWKNAQTLSPSDFRGLYIPFLFWILIVLVFGGRSWRNFLVVDLPIVGLLTGLYLIKIPLTEKFKIKKSVSIILLLIICSLITIIHFMLPSLSP